MTMRRRIKWCNNTFWGTMHAWSGKFQDFGCEIFGISYIFPSPLDRLHFYLFLFLFSFSSFFARFNESEWHTYITSGILCNVCRFVAQQDARSPLPVQEGQILQVKLKKKPPLLLYVSYDKWLSKSFNKRMRKINIKTCENPIYCYVYSFSFRLPWS